MTHQIASADNQWQFSLQLAAYELDTIADTLQTTHAALNAIRVMVTITLSNVPAKALSFDYHITVDDETLAACLDWSDWHAEHVRFTDYLWQETCLECFIAPKNSATYIEVNVSPDGRYALYQFSDYRTPNHLPPPALYHKQYKKAARIHWPLPSTNIGTAAKATSEQDTQGYGRCFSIPLSELRAIDPNFHPAYLHPCVILKLADTHLYFAPAHPSPPDFHNKDYWTAL